MSFIALTTPAWALKPDLRFCNVQSFSDSYSGYTRIAAEVHDPNGKAPSFIKSVTVEWPGGSTTTMTSRNYDPASNEFYIYLPGTTPPAGQYKFTALNAAGESATSYYYVVNASSLPIVDSFTFNAYGDMLAPTLSWSDLRGYNGNALFSAVIYDARHKLVWASSLTGLTSVSVPSGQLASGNTYYWRVFTQDNSWGRTSDNVSVSNPEPLTASGPWSLPGFLYARVYSFALPDGSISTALDVQVATSQGKLPGDICSLKVSAPNGSTVYSFQHGDYSESGNNYYRTIPGVPVDGTYTFLATDMRGNQAESYHYFQSATIPKADEKTLQASGDPLAPTLTWAAPAADKRLFYSVGIWEPHRELKWGGLKGWQAYPVPCPKEYW